MLPTASPSCNGGAPGGQSWWLADEALYRLANFKGCNIAGIGYCDEASLQQHGYTPEYSIPAFAVPKAWVWLDKEGKAYTAAEATEAGLEPKAIRLLWPERYNWQAELGSEVKAVESD